MKLLTLLVYLLSLLAITAQVSQPCNCHLSHHFTLQFDYAAHQGIDFTNSQFTITWNHNRVKVITPKDYNINHVSIPLTAKEGVNYISFMSRGTSNGKGVTIDNIQVHRPDQEVDKVYHSIDSTFEDQLGEGEKIWQGKNIKVGHGPNYNQHWKKGNHVLVLGSSLNSEASKELFYDKHMRQVVSQEVHEPTPAKPHKPRKNRFILQFDYAARQRIPLDSNQFAIFWNGRAKIMMPRDYNRHHFKFPVFTKVGRNVLSFVARGAKDGLGPIIDNVKLTRGQLDLVKNGGFQQGHLIGLEQNIFQTLPGWTGGAIKIGNGHTYNQFWKNGDHVCELDTNQNSALTQIFNFNKNFNPITKPKSMMLRFQYAARSAVPLSSNWFSVYFNGKKIKFFKPKDYIIHNVELLVKAIVGKNRLKFVGQGQSDSLGCTIDNVSLMNGNKNVIVNGKFSKPSVGKGWKVLKAIPGWKGDIQIGISGIYNTLWKTDSQVTQLDSGKNSSIYQDIVFKPGFQ